MPRTLKTLERFSTTTNGLQKFAQLALGKPLEETNGLILALRLEDRVNRAKTLSEHVKQCLKNYVTKEHVSKLDSMDYQFAKSDDIIFVFKTHDRGERIESLLLTCFPFIEARKKIEWGELESVAA